MSLKTEKTCSAELAVVITLPIFIQMSLKIHCYDVNLSVEIKSKLKRVGQRHSFPSDYQMLLSDSILFLSHLSWNQKPDLLTLMHLAQNHSKRKEKNID